MARNEVVCTVECAAGGKIKGLCDDVFKQFRVNSDEIAPVSDKGDTAFIIDLQEAAFCDGRGKWYSSKAGGVVSINAGQTWAELFA